MKPRTKTVLFIVGFLFLAGAAAGFYMFNLKAKDLSKVKPDYVITATDLLKAFEEDEVAAAAMYVGKTVEVTGEIGSVTPGEDNSLNVALKTGSDFSAIICTVPVGAAAGSPDSGTQVSVRGECSGYLMDVLLKNCVIITQ